MNFQHMPELRWLHGYPFALGLMGLTAMTLLVWFWRKGWIGGPHLSRRRGRRL
jgi:magnesium transporter